MHKTNYASVARGFTRILPRELQGGSELIDWLPAKRHLDHLRDRRLVLATLRGIKRPVQMIRAGIPAARHNRNACMSTAPPGRIGVKSTENLKVPNPAV